MVHACMVQLSSFAQTSSRTHYSSKQDGGHAAALLITQSGTKHIRILSQDKQVEQRAAAGT